MLKLSRPRVRDLCDMAYALGVGRGGWERAWATHVEAFARGPDGAHLEWL